MKRPAAKVGVFHQHRPIGKPPVRLNLNVSEQVVGIGMILVSKRLDGTTQCDRPARECDGQDRDDAPFGGRHFYRFQKTPATMLASTAKPNIHQYHLIPRARCGTLPNSRAM